MRFTVVSFYTEHTPYEKEMCNLRSSLERHGLQYHIKGVPSLGSWEKNCQHKARFILEAMDTFDTNIVWLDADAVVARYPSLFDELSCDIAYHYLPHRRELLSGTLFIMNNSKMRQVVTRWIEVNATNNNWDQKNLQVIVEKETGIEKFILPAEYCKIYDNKLQAVTDPVITHYQASRRFRKMIQQPVNARRR